MEKKEIAALLRDELRTVGLDVAEDDIRIKHDARGDSATVAFPGMLQTLEMGSIEARLHLNNEANLRQTVKRLAAKQAAIVAGASKVGTLRTEVADAVRPVFAEIPHLGVPEVAVTGVGPKEATFAITYVGYDEDLYGRTLKINAGCKLDGDGPTEIVRRVRKALEGQRKFAAAAGGRPASRKDPLEIDHLLVELPFSEFLVREHGGNAVEVLRSLVRDALARRDAGIKKPGEGEMHVTVNVRQVRFRTQLAPGVHWKAGVIVIEKTMLPDTIVNSLGGQPASLVIDHPLLADARNVVTKVTCDATSNTHNKGTTAIAVMAPLVSPAEISRMAEERARHAIERKTA